MTGLSEEQKKRMVNNWIGTLSFRFGGLDFWRLSKKWKAIRYAEMATMIVDEMDWVMRNQDKL